VPWSLQRFQQSGQTHFVTFSCFRRCTLLAEVTAKGMVESALERVRWKFGLYVYGYVVMPEHVHLLVGEWVEVAQAWCFVAVDRQVVPFLVQALLRF
jgi:putative transposase